jgi:hypothetical protein
LGGGGGIKFLPGPNKKKKISKVAAFYIWKNKETNFAFFHDC